MYRFTARMLVLSLFCVTSGHAAATPADVTFSIVKTAKLTVREGVVFAGGDFTRSIDNVFSAVLVKHGSSSFLFDTGLGRRVGEQYHQDMPYWQRPFFAYDEPVSPVRDQLDAARIAPITQIILSHSHWDHASGIVDFPDAEVWVAPEEMAVIQRPESGVGGSWGSQMASKSIRWRSFDFTDKPYAGFAKSVDLFQDGKVIIVPLNGHTPGSIGMFVTVSSGRRFFFCGDTIWNVRALENGAPKFWPARLLVDKDAQQTLTSVLQIRDLVQKHPDVVVVPAHDGTVQGALGYFPVWVK